jgi:hypothetical protein
LANRNISIESGDNKNGAPLPREAPSTGKEVERVPRIPHDVVIAAHRAAFPYQLADLITSGLCRAAEVVRWDTDPATGVSVPVFRVPAEHRMQALGLGLRLED